MPVWEWGAPKGELPARPRRACSSDLRSSGASGKVALCVPGKAASYRLAELPGQVGCPGQVGILDRWDTLDKWGAGQASPQVTLSHFQPLEP